jgi:hypothetical protein
MNIVVLSVNLTSKVVVYSPPGQSHDPKMALKGYSRAREKLIPEVENLVSVPLKTYPTIPLLRL